MSARPLNVPQILHALAPLDRRTRVDGWKDFATDFHGSKLRVYYRVNEYGDKRRDIAHDVSAVRIALVSEGHFEQEISMRVIGNELGEYEAKIQEELDGEEE